MGTYGEPLFSRKDLLDNNRFHTHSDGKSEKLYVWWRALEKGKYTTPHGLPSNNIENSFKRKQAPAVVKFMDWADSVNLFDYTNEEKYGFGDGFTEFSPIFPFIHESAVSTLLSGHLCESAKTTTVSGMREYEKDFMKKYFEGISIQCSELRSSNSHFSWSLYLEYMFPILKELGIPVGKKTESFRELPRYWKELSPERKKSTVKKIIEKKSDNTSYNNHVRIHLPIIEGEENTENIIMELKNFVIDSFPIMKDRLVNCVYPKSGKTDNYQSYMWFKLKESSDFLLKLAQTPSL
jgi:hypothetical protein